MRLYAHETGYNSGQSFCPLLSHLEPEVAIKISYRPACAAATCRDRSRDGLTCSYICKFESNQMTPLWSASEY